MLPKQLQEIENHLASLPNLTKDQKKLLDELNYINYNNLSDDFFADYLYQEIKFESFAPPSDRCPNCGKKY